MPISAQNAIPLAEYKAPEANFDLVTEVTVNPSAEILMATDIGQNDNRMMPGNFRTFMVGSSATLDGLSAGIEVKDAGITATQLADNAVTTTAIAADAVTVAKLAQDALGYENAVKYGADPTGADDSTAAIQAALNTGRSVYLPDGMYAISSTLTMTAIGQSLFGNGKYACRLVSKITNGSPTLDTNGQVGISVYNFRIWGDNQTKPYQNTRGLFWNNSTRSYISNVDVRYCNDGASFVDSWVLSAFNFWVRDCVVGTTMSQINASSIQLNTANVDEAIKLTTCNGTLIEYSVEGTVPTTSSTIDNCVGLNFTKFYVEHNPMGVVPEFVIGGSQECRGLVFNGINVTRGGDMVATWAFDQVENVEIGPGNFSNGVSGLAWTTTANSKSVKSRLQGATGSQGNYLPPPTFGTIPGNNLYRDPYLVEGLPQFAQTVRSTATLDNTITPEGMNQSIRVTVDDAGFAHAEVRLDLTSDRYKSLLGQQCGVGAQMHAPDTPPYQSDLGRCSIYAEVNGTGGGAVPTRNQDYIPGKWVMSWNELAIPSDATILTVRMYANQSQDDLTGQFVNFGAVSVWVGGAQAACKFYSGELGLLGDELELQPPNTLLANADAFLTILPKPVGIGDLPSTGSAPGTLALCQDPSGNLAHSDLSTISAESRKTGTDSVAYSATPTVDFESGQFDNKEIELTGDITNVTFSAVRQTDYELKFKQDGTGGRQVAISASNIKPPFSELVPIDPRAGRTYTLRLYFDGTNFNWG